MRKASIALICSTLLLTACSEEPGGVGGSEPSTAGSELPALPTTRSERVLLEGKMSFWMYEGDAGCYGTLVRGVEEVELWADVETCAEHEYADNEPAAVVVTYRSDEQWGAGDSYSIVEFR